MTNAVVQRIDGVIEAIRRGVEQLESQLADIQVRTSTGIPADTEAADTLLEDLKALADYFRSRAVPFIARLDQLRSHFEAVDISDAADELQTALRAKIGASLEKLDQLANMASRLAEHSRN